MSDRRDRTQPFRFATHRHLRTYWYGAACDGSRCGSTLNLTSEHGIKLRLGRLTSHGQRGVDSRLRVRYGTASSKECGGYDRPPRWRPKSFAREWWRRDKLESLLHSSGRSRRPDVITKRRPWVRRQTITSFSRGPRAWSSCHKWRCNGFGSRFRRRRLCKQKLAS